MADCWFVVCCPLSVVRCPKLMADSWLVVCCPLSVVRCLLSCSLWSLWSAYCYLPTAYCFFWSVVPLRHALCCSQSAVNISSFFVLNTRHSTLFLLLTAICLLLTISRGLLSLFVLSLCAMRFALCCRVAFCPLVCVNLRLVCFLRTWRPLRLCSSPRGIFSRPGR